MVKISFRTVQGKQFQLEFDDGAKIVDVKAKIEETQGADFPKDSMNVIHQGKVLKDEAAVQESNISETGFCVVMVVKKRPAPKEEAPKPAAATTEAPPAAPAPTEAAAAPPPTAAPPTTTATETTAAGQTTADPYASAASELATGSALEEKVNQIVEMGFPKEDVLRAMRAAFNNPDRAVEYLMTGIPEGLLPPAGGAAGAGGAPPQAAPAPTNQPFNMFAPGAQSGGAEEPAAAAGPLAVLRNNPQFQALRAIVQQNPTLLQPMLQELGKNQPELLQAINANQQEFLSMINEPVPGGEMQALMQQMAAEMGAMEEEGGEAIEIELSPEEMAAIERLQGLGFPREACIEAFLLCDKNEEMAANFLLENATGGGDFM